MFMSAQEKQISFYNRYFIFRKNRNINAKQLKNSFLSYAGLQEEQDRAAGGPGSTQEKKGEDELAAEQLALEKISKASRPIDVATKPAIAAHILAETAATSAVAGTATVTGTGTTLKIKPKPKPRVKTAKTTAASEAPQQPQPQPIEEEMPSAPIAQIEKKIQKRTKKAKATEAGEAPPATARKTKKKTDL
jgi:hypothetical protein